MSNVNDRLATLAQYHGVRAANRAAEKRGEVLRWLWLWALTDRYVIGQLLGLQRAAAYRTVSKLLRAGLVAQVRVEGMPVPALHLTPAGAEAVAPFMEDTGFEDMRPVVYASRLNVRQSQHDLLVQRVVLSMYQLGNIDYDNDRMLRHREVRILDHGKIPDALITVSKKLGEDQTWALEVVQTLPPPSERERIVSMYAVAAMEAGVVHGTIFASTSQAILDTMQRTAEGNVRRWKYAPEHKRWMPWPKEPSPVTPEYLEDHLMYEPLAQHAATLYQYVVK